MTIAVPAATPTRLGPEERDAVRAAVLRVTDDGPWSGGPQITAFEEAFSAYLGSGEVVGCANGTDAITLAFLGLDLPPGSAVLVPGHDGGYAATAARRADLEPVAVDVDPETGDPTVATLEAAAASVADPRAIVITHLHGDPVELRDIDAWRRRHRFALIEDGAQAHGARIDGRRVGSIGDAGAFSFYPTKNLGAVGDAGAVAFADPAAAARARALAQYGWGDRYRVMSPRGRNSRLDPVQAAVLLARLPHLDARNARRSAVRALYRAAAPGLRFLGGPGGVAHHAVVRTDDRAALIEHLTSRRIGVAIHYPFAVSGMPGLGVTRAPTPEAERLATQVLSVPCTPELHDDEVDAVSTALSEWTRG